MKYVSKEEYENAVLIVQAYHQQVESSIKARAFLADYKVSDKVSPKAVPSYKNSTAKGRVAGESYNLDHIRTGDFILSVNTKSDHITVGKKYEVINGNRGAIRIKDDSDVMKAISRQNKFRLWKAVY